MNEADFLWIYFKANNEFALWSWEYVLVLLTMGSPSVSNWKEKETEGLLEVISSKFPPGLDISSVPLMEGKRR